MDCIGNFDWFRNIIISIQKYTKLHWLKQSFSYLAFKQIIGFFVVFSEDGYSAKSGSPSCLICFFFRLKAHKWCCFVSLQHFRAKEFEEAQGRAFWQILWRSIHFWFGKLECWLPARSSPGTVGHVLFLLHGPSSWLGWASHNMKDGTPEGAPQDQVLSEDKSQHPRQHCPVQ